MIQRINSNNSRVIDDAEINEQLENANDFGKLVHELNVLLARLNTSSNRGWDEIETDLFELHRILTTFEWHFSELTDLNMKLLKGHKNS